MNILMVILIALFIAVLALICAIIFSFTRFGSHGGKSQSSQGQDWIWTQERLRHEFQQPQVTGQVEQQPQVTGQVSQPFINVVPLMDGTFIPGRVIYQDKGNQGFTFYSEVNELAGRPDMVIEDPDGKLIVVENKTGVEVAWPSHKRQIATYFILCAEHYGRPIDFGILVFRSRHFRVENTEALRQQVLATRNNIQKKEETGEPCRETDNPNKCKGCSVRIQCKGEAGTAGAGGN